MNDQSRNSSSGPTYKQIANGARSFFTICRAFIDQRSGVSSSTIVGIDAIPYYVNAAFACELYMKAIIKYHNSDMTNAEFKKLGHNLADLFKNLPMDAQRSIKSNIPDREVTKNQKILVKKWATLLESDVDEEVKTVARHTIDNTPTSFDDILEKHSKAFNDWRYFYEGGRIISLDEWFLFTFCNALHNLTALIMNKSQ